MNHLILLILKQLIDLIYGYEMIIQSKKVGVNLHRPLLKVKEFISKTLENLVTNINHFSCFREKWNILKLLR